MPQTLWNLVLAAGAGRRLAGLTGGTPKQFWGPAGGKTMLEATLDRVAALAGPHRTVIVVDQSHAPFVHALPHVARNHRVVYQPRDRGTAAGVLLGLTKIATIDSDAIVLLTPADHGIRQPAAFAASVRSAVGEVLTGRSRFVMFGTPPTSADGDYGWITPAGTPAQFREVAAFVEKPEPTVVRQLFETGAVWNTMVLVARVSDLLDLYRRHAPVLLRAFLPLLHIDAPAHAAFLKEHYETLPTRDFSRDVIGKAVNLTVCTWPVSMGWSDLGTPERLARWAQGQAVPVSVQAPAPALSRPPATLQIANA